MEFQGICPVFRFMPALRIGWVPCFEDVQWDGIDFSEEQFEELENVNREAWKREVMDHEELFIALHDHLPPEMIYERELLIRRL